MRIKRRPRRLIAVILVLAALGYNWWTGQGRPWPPGRQDAPAQVTKDNVPSRNAPQGGDVARAYRERLDSVQVTGEGIVTRLLPDDLEGSRHQKFILRIEGGPTVLVAHNIDLAPRIPSLRKGDRVAFYGEYEWTERGGVVHWTHRDPANRHPHGWLRHKGRVYQ